MAQKLPHNIEAEQSVIGCILLDNRVINNVIDQLNEDDFYYEKHRVIFKAIEQIFKNGKSVDLTTLTSLLRDQEKLTIVGDVKYLAELSESVPSTANIDSYISLVKEKSLLRNLIDTAQNIAMEGQQSNKNIEDIIDEAERKILDVSNNRRTSEFKEISNVSVNVINNIEHLSKSKGEITGLKTNFYDLDKLTLGLQNDDLFIIAARPAVGKTAFVLNLATNVAKFNDTGVAIFSLEMSAEQLVSRVLSSQARVEAQKMKKGNLSEKEWQRLIAAQHTLSELNIYIDDTAGIKVQDVRAKCRRLYQENKLGLVVIDYLQLLSSNKSTNNRQEEVSDISRTLKEIAREFHVPVIACAQLSRQVERREEKRPVMSDLRESGSIEQDADVVTFLYRDEYYNAETDRANITELIFSKNRHGPTGEVEFLFIKEYSAFENLGDNFNKNNNPKKTNVNDKNIDLDMSKITT